MLSLASTTKIFLVTGSTDMRKSFDTLSAIVSETLAEDPFSGHAFIFSNRRRNRLKILLWESSGFWLLAKRLEKGTFAWPASTKRAVTLSSSELAMLLGGIDLAHARRRRWYKRPGSSIERTFVDSR